MRENLASAQSHIVALEGCFDTSKEHYSLLEAARQYAESERTKAQEALALAEKQIEMHAQRIQTLEERESTLEAEKQRAKEEMAELCERLSAHHKQIHQIQQSLGWMLLNRAQVVRSRLIRDDAMSGRCWTALTRYLKSVGASGSGPRLPGNVPNSGEIAR